MEKIHIISKNSFNIIKKCVSDNYVPSKLFVEKGKKKIDHKPYKFN